MTVSALVCSLEVSDPPVDAWPPQAANGIASERESAIVAMVLAVLFILGSIPVVILASPHIPLYTMAVRSEDSYRFADKIEVRMGARVSLRELHGVPDFVDSGHPKRRITAGIEPTTHGFYHELFQR